MASNVASIDQILRQAVNPFDPATFKPGNFWQENPEVVLTVESIHQEVLDAIEETLDQVVADQRTRTLLVIGDSGAGKSHLLGRLKQTLNSKAFFVYIGPWADSSFIWRHILRQTVDSLVQVPEGQQESQLILWLKSLSIFKKKSLLDRILGDRKAFIRQLRETYKAKIYNANEFFGVLFDLLNPELQLTACDWLRGDDLDEEDLKLIKVKASIDSEDAAQKILENFGKIATETQPIVLCFDNLDGIPRSSNGFIDLQTLFSVNSALHNEKLQNFLSIISIIKNTWIEHSRRIQDSDKARIDASISLKTITIEQAEALWQVRLHPLHQQASGKPPTPIYPLDRAILEQRFPGGKTHPRIVLELGRRLFIEYKTGKPAKDDPLVIFKLIWLKELQKIQQKLTRIRQFSSPELIQMLREVLLALQLEDVRLKFLPSPTYTLYSLSYLFGADGRIGVIWTEDPNLTSFFHIMNACQKAIQVDLCQGLTLIRAEKMGSPSKRGHQLYKEIFTGDPDFHVVPDLDSVHYLATYHSLVNAARSRDLMIGSQIPSPEELAVLVRDSQVLKDCRLLQDIGVVTKKSRKAAKKSSSRSKQGIEESQSIKEFIFNLVKINGLLGIQVLTQNTLNQYPYLQEFDVEQLIKRLCREKKIQLVDPDATPDAQLVCIPGSR